MENTGRSRKYKINLNPPADGNTSELRYILCSVTTNNVDNQLDATITVY